MADPVSFTVARGIGVCVADALAGTVGGSPARVCYLVAGDIADDACDCGMLAVTTSRVYNARVPPAVAEDDGNAGPCGLPYEVTELVVRVMRCAANPDSRGRAPSCPGLEADALIWHDDKRAVRRALGCCLRELEEQNTIAGFVLGVTEAQGPLGGCVGSNTTVRFWTTNCLCPPGP